MEILLEKQGYASE